MSGIYTMTERGNVGRITGQMISGFMTEKRNDKLLKTLGFKVLGYNVPGDSVS